MGNTLDKKTVKLINLFILIIVLVIFLFGYFNLSLSNKSIYKEINYFPGNHSWEKMWTEWDPAEINNELNFANDLGIKSVDTQIPYYVFYNESMQQINSTLMERAQQFVNISHGKNMKVIFTLFDKVTNVSDETKWKYHEDFLSKFISNFTNDNNIEAWGLHNEIDLLITTDKNPRSEVLNWTKEMTQTIRQIDKNHSIEIEVTDVDNVSEFAPYADRIGLSAYKYVLNSQFTLDMAVKELQTDANGKNVTISEVGWASNGTSGEERQKNVYNYFLSVAKSNGISVRIWTLMDFSNIPNNLPESEKHFGLITTNYTKKPAYFIFKNFPN